MVVDVTTLKTNLERIAELHSSETVLGVRMCVLCDYDPATVAWSGKSLWPCLTWMLATQEPAVVEVWERFIADGSWDHDKALLAAVAVQRPASNQ